MSYRGRVMNRAARIASKASAGRVLCSEAALDAMREVASPVAAAEDVGPLAAQ